MTIIVAIFCMAQLYAASPVKQWGQLQVKGAQLCDQSGNPVVLRGVSLGWHNIWPRFYNKQASRKMARHRLACQHHPCSDGHPDRRQLSGKS